MQSRHSRDCRPTAETPRYRGNIFFGSLNNSSAARPPRYHLRILVVFARIPARMIEARYRGNIVDTC